MRSNPKTIMFAFAVGAAGVVGLIVYYLAPGEEPTEVRIIAEGREYAAVPLPEHRTLNVPGPLGTTTVEVDGRRVRVISSPCPNKICVAQGWIERPGETITCLPNRVSITLVK